MEGTQTEGVERLYAESEAAFAQWEVLKDLVDEMIDLMLNYRQSGHPGGSRSKVHALLATMLSGAMHWDILRPWRPLCDRLVLSAGHTIPLVYGCLAVLNEAMRQRHRREGDQPARPVRMLSTASRCAADAFSSIMRDSIQSPSIMWGGQS